MRTNQTCYTFFNEFTYFTTLFQANYKYSTKDSWSYDLFSTIQHPSKNKNQPQTAEIPRKALPLYSASVL